MIVRTKGTYNQEMGMMVVEHEFVPHDPLENDNLKKVLAEGKADFAFMPEGEVLKGVLQIKVPTTDAAAETEPEGEPEGDKKKQYGEQRGTISGEAPPPTPDNENL